MLSSVSGHHAERLNTSKGRNTSEMRLKCNKTKSVHMPNSSDSISDEISDQYSLLSARIIFSLYNYIIICHQCR